MYFIALIPSLYPKGESVGYLASGPYSLGLVTWVWSGAGLAGANLLGGHYKGRPFQEREN